VCASGSGNTMPTFSELTTMRVGGEPTNFVRVTTEAELVAVVRDVWGRGEPWLLLGGGSNMVMSDEGFPGTIIHVATRGIECVPGKAGVVRLRVQAGEPWDDVVAYAVAHGYSGIEALSGIPGSVGAAPVQNIGAYGQEVSSTLVGVDFFDATTHEVTRIPVGELGLGYRRSVLKEERQGVVTAVELELVDTVSETEPLGAPIAYEQLANALAVNLGGRVSLAEVRRAVLHLRASKGMVLNPTDHDTWSCGSFFTNPIVSENFARSLPAAMPRWPMTVTQADRIVPLEQAHLVDLMPIVSSEGLYEVKLSAAWMIEHAGISRGFALPGSSAAISDKHTLAITNRGNATASQIAELARYIHGRVEAEFGVSLQPEPVLVGIAL
jgi:UDP-N-acetylmuramate dehydrogenase